jgi:DeoR/GlpR family transcriptional regulator of sugar metabolism
VVTHSPTIAVALAGHAQIEVLMLGGRLFRHSMVNVGASVVEAAARLRADLYLMGVTGVHATAGLTTGDFEEAAVKRALHERAAETVVLASADKLGAASPFTIAPLSELAALVVPASTPAALRKKLQADGVKVSTATA